MAASLEFKKSYPVVGQTCSRKVDAAVLHVLAGIATSVHKFSNDIRLLSNLREIEEPFGSKQVGSSAMAYKRNPMRCERATGLARFVMSLASSPLSTAAEQWFERTLDDSANSRVSVPEAFLATDGMLRIMADVVPHLAVYPQVIASRISAELPFMATENILMAAVKSGGDRQALHERIRRHSHAATRQVKQHGRANDLMDRLAADEAFATISLENVLNPTQYVGLAPRQTRDFVRFVVDPIRRRYPRSLGKRADLTV